MSTEAILAALSEAARQHETVTVSVLTDHGEEQITVEPYSVVERRRRPTFYAWDVGLGRVVGLPVESLTGASLTHRHFRPRYEVEL